jgi:hypothetical protein
MIIFSLHTVAHLCSCGQPPENCALLDYYAASSGNSLPTFRDNLSVSPQGSRWGTARDTHWLGGWVGLTACQDTNLMRLIYAHIFVPFLILKQAPWTRAITNSRCQALRRHDPGDFFTLFFTNCFYVVGHPDVLFFLQQFLPLLVKFLHYLIKKYKVRTFRKTVWMRWILPACTHRQNCIRNFDGETSTEDTTWQI